MPPRTARPAEVQFILRPVGGGTDITVGAAKGKRGIWDVSIFAPNIPLPGVTDFGAPGVTGAGEFRFNTEKLKTLNNVTLGFTVESKGSMGFVQRGQKGVVYFREAQ